MSREDSFWGNIFGKQAAPEERGRAALRKTPVFKDLSDRDLTVIERMLHRRQYDVGEIIFYQGDSGVGMYIIDDGEVEIVHEPSGEVLAILFAGDFFGEIALLNELPRSATARAKTRCGLLFFSQADLYKLLELNPQAGSKISLRLAKIIGKRLTSANEKIGELRQRLNEVEGEAGKP